MNADVRTVCSGFMNSQTPMRRIRIQSLSICERIQSESCNCHARDCQAPEGETISDLSDGALASISTETEVDRDGHDAVWTDR